MITYDVFTFFYHTKNFQHSSINISYAHHTQFAPPHTRFQCLCTDKSNFFLRFENGVGAFTHMHLRRTRQWTINVILQPFQGLNIIPQPYEGLQMQSFKPSKDYGCDASQVEGLHVQSFNPSKDYVCNPYKDLSISCNPSTL